MNFFGKHDEDYLKFNTTSNCVSSSAYLSKTEIDDLVERCTTDNASVSTITDVSDYVNSATSNCTFKVAANNSAISSLADGELALDTSTNNLYIGTNGTVASIGSSSNITWTSGPYTTTATGLYGWNSYNYYEKENEMITAIFQYLDEPEIEIILDSMKDRGISEELFNSMVSKIESNRHLSEEFIMKYIDSFNMDVLKVKYASEIRSQKYKNLALLVAIEK